MLKKHLNIEDLKKQIKRDLPRLIFLAGKTCTGKSTFALDLKNLGYKHIELDVVVRQNVVQKFPMSDQSQAFSVYTGNAPKEWQISFEKATRTLIKEELKSSKVVVEAAIADVNILKRIFTGELKYFVIIFFHPFNRKFYYLSILNKFIDDLRTQKRSFPLWRYVTPEVINDYNKKEKKGAKVRKLIREYADQSIINSVKRYQAFKNVYPNIILTGY